MSDFSSITEAKTALKGNICFKVISLGDLKSGNNKKGEPYQKQDAVIKDASSAMNLTLWNDDIGKLEVGQCYSLTNGWWSQYKGEPQLTLGNYYELKKINESEVAMASPADPNQSTLQKSDGSPTTTTTTTPSQGFTINDKLDGILHEIDLIKGMVEPLFQQMVDRQISQETKE